MPCVSSTSPAEQEPDLTLDAGGGQRLSQIARIAQMAAFGRRTWWFGRLRNPARVDHVTMRVALSRAAVRVSGPATSSTPHPVGRVFRPCHLRYPRGYV